MVRYKKRYLLVEISFEDNKIDETMSSPCIYEHVRNAVQEAHGDYGRACLARSLRVKYVNPVTGVAFIGCGRDNYRMLWSSITFIKKIQNKRCMCRVLHVGGTLRSCQKFVIRHNKEQLLQLLEQCKTPGEQRKVAKAIDKAEKYEMSLDPIEVMKRKASAKESYSKHSLEEFDTD